jgi:hypothetical protein
MCWVDGLLLVRLEVSTGGKTVYKVSVLLDPSLDPFGLVEAPADWSKCSTLPLNYEIQLF